MQPITNYLDDVTVTRDNLPVVEVYDFKTDNLISKTNLNFEESDFGTLFINKKAKDKRTVLLISDSDITLLIASIILAWLCLRFYDMPIRKWLTSKTKSCKSKNKTE